MFLRVSEVPIFDWNMKYFYYAKISLSETPISLWEIPNLPIWLEENITCMSVLQVMYRTVTEKCRMYVVNTNLSPLSKVLLIWILVLCFSPPHPLVHLNVKFKRVYELKLQAIRGDP